MILLLTNVIQWFFAKSEGRYFISRGLGGKGLDLIRHQPMSNKLKLSNLVWKGRLWQLGKEGMLFGIEKIQNPETDDDYLYNDLVGRSCTWDGARRPVVMATDIMSTVITPEFYAAVEKAESFDKYPKAKDILTQVAEYAKANKLQVVTYAQTFHPSTIKKYLKDVGPQHMREAFKKGVEAQKLANTKPPGEGLKLGNLAFYILIGVVAIIIVYFGLPFIQTLVKTK